MTRHALVGRRAGVELGRRLALQARREAARELDLRVRRVGWCNTPKVHAGFDVTSQLLTRSPTAVIAYNILAIGVIKGLRRTGVGVPTDASVVGFDNIILSEIVDPELTTVAAPLRDGHDRGHEPHRRPRRRHTEPRAHRHTGQAGGPGLDRSAQAE